MKKFEKRKQERKKERTGNINSIKKTFIKFKDERKLYKMSGKKKKKRQSSGRKKKNDENKRWNINVTFVWKKERKKKKKERKN